MNNLNEILGIMKKNVEAKNKTAIEENTKELMELLVFSMFPKGNSNSESVEIFGHMLMMISRKIDYTLMAPMGVMLKDTYYNLAVNPLFLINYTESEIKAILIHEMYHIIFNHLKRSKNLDRGIIHDYINIAMDCSINQYITGLPKDCVTLKYVEKLCGHNLLEKQEYEYYLENLIQSKAYQKDKQMQSKMNELLNELKDAIDDYNNGGSGQSKSGKSIKDILDEMEKNGIKISSHDSWDKCDENDLNNIEKIAKDFINKAIDKCSGRGNIPGVIIEKINAMGKKTEISWQKEFKYLIGNIKIPYKRTFTRPNRRLPERTDISGRMMDRTLKLAVAIDTSGSMGEKDLEFVFNEIFGIIKSVKYELNIIECDTKVNRVYEVKNRKDVKTEVTGRGGTSFTPVFEYIHHTRSLRNDLDLLIYFTDGYGESHIDEAYKPRGYNVMWVITENKENLSVNNPFTNKIKTLHVHE